MGSGKGGSNNNNNNTNNGGGLNQIPTSSKKVIQSIKEIVDFPDDEIYLMLKDCNMDPSEAVNRLLSQDTFHEVKSKREKKKEVKGGTDSRPRGSSTSTRGGRTGMDRYSTRNSSSQFGSSDYAASRGKPVYKKETEPLMYPNPTTNVAGNNVNTWQTAVGDTSTDKTFSTNEAESILPTPQPSGFQPPWSGRSGQVSMADIVKMGRQNGKTSNSQQHMNRQPATSSLPAPYDSYPSESYASKVSEVSQNIPPNDEWLRDEELPATRGISVIEHSGDSEPYNDAYDEANQQFGSHTDDVGFEGDHTVGDEQATFVESVPASNQIIQENNSVSASGFDDDQYQNYDSYQVHHHEVEDPSLSVSSMTNNFESLSFPKDDVDTQSEDDGLTVKIPDHLQVQTADLSHLSFGSFGSGMNAPFSGSFGSRPVHSNEEEAASPTITPSVGHSEARNSEYYEDDHLRTRDDGNDAQRIEDGPGNFEGPSVSQTDMLQQEAPEVAQVNQYSFPSSTANYTFEDNQQLNSSFAYSQASPQMMQGLPSLSGVMPYSNSMPNPLLASNMHPLRETELAYSQFPISQSLAAKYGNSASPLSGPAASMAESLKSSNLAAQPTQNHQGGNISGPTGLPQHLAMHPYSQHSLPVGPLNMMGYPFLPQGYSYMPSAYQQAFAAGNNTYPQSLAAMLPQYKNSVSVSSLPQSGGAVPSGYGGFGNSGNFPLNPPSAPPGAPLNYEDLLASQYKDASHLLSLQQGAESRTMSGVPGNTYYSFQGQNQQPAGFRQSQQQPSQHYAPPSGYPNYYHSQTGLSLEHQQQLSRDGSSQNQQPKQTQQQLWQNSY